MKRNHPTRRGLATQALGRRGEEMAAEWMVNQGYRVRGRNVRTRLGEIDLVVEKGNTIVIVEVKTRRTSEAGLPLEAITAIKAARLRRLAGAYMADQGLAETHDLRIDCVGILTGAELGKEEIDHVEDAV